MINLGDDIIICYIIIDHYNITNDMNNITSNVNAILGAILVIVGVILKNSFEQLKLAHHPIGKYGGMLFFVLGWTMVAQHLAILHPTKKYIIYGASLAIVLAVMGLKYGITASWLPGIFVLGWLILGFTVNQFQGLIGAMAIILSMTISLPWQRKHCVVDGPGLPLFILGWILVLGKFDL